MREVKPDATVLYVPPPTAADAILEAIENKKRVDSSTRQKVVIGSGWPGSTSTLRSTLAYHFGAASVIEYVSHSTSQQQADALSAFNDKEETWIMVATL